MIFSRTLKCVALLTACVVIVSGCRTPSTDLTDEGLLGFDDIDAVDGGGIPLGARFEDGIPITDVHFENVLFGYDSFVVESSQAAKVEAVADYMRRSPEVRLVVEGHCDERGSRDYNMSLGESRALAVRAYLVGLGVDGGRVQTRSFGEEQPQDSGHTPEAYRLNRRGVFALFR
ncbi:MAG: OmpA family protein [Kiritimatiellia bacterium]|jgi:peptidoglycan-associated lipoprotein|nr:OmpA family protein [Kiritimatiellia bacterium]MDP6847600.1 OmpA family protein [Kiritimatiellia bacterium]